MNRTKVERRFARVLALAGMLSLISASQAAEVSDKEALAKAAQNPIASLISLPFQNNTNFGIGPDDKTENVLNIQPVWPFSIGENWNLITRTIVPVISQPGSLPGESRENGLGDVSFTGFFSPKKSGAWTWGVGPVIEAPTATDDRLGFDHWRAGISFVGLSMPGNWVFGALVANKWSVGSHSGEPDINAMLIQPFINYNIPNGSGVYFTSAPIITANWEAEDSGDRWTIPLGGGLGKVFKVGRRPLNTQVQAFYNVVKPDQAADWQLRLQLQLLFPK